MWKSGDRRNLTFMHITIEKGDSLDTIFFQQHHYGFEAMRAIAVATEFECNKLVFFNILSTDACDFTRLNKITGLIEKSRINHNTFFILL